MRPIFAALLFLSIFTTSANASFLTNVAVGDAFSGTFNITPNAPGDDTLGNYGTFLFDIGGHTITGPVLAIFNGAFFASWNVVISPLQLDGVDLGINSQVQITLFGGPQPILPTAPYTDAQLYFEFHSQDMSQRGGVLGSVTSFEVAPNSRTIDFSGTVTYYGEIAPIPEASTWSMMLIGFCVIGFAAHGRRDPRVVAA